MLLTGYQGGGARKLHGTREPEKLAGAISHLGKIALDTIICWPTKIMHLQQQVDGSFNILWT